MRKWHSRRKNRGGRAWREGGRRAAMRHFCTVAAGEASVGAGDRASRPPRPRGGCGSCTPPRARGRRRPRPPLCPEARAGRSRRRRPRCRRRRRPAQATVGRCSAPGRGRRPAAGLASTVTVRATTGLAWSLVGRLVDREKPQARLDQLGDLDLKRAGAGGAAAPVHVDPVARTQEARDARRHVDPDREGAHPLRQARRDAGVLARLGQLDGQDRLVLLHGTQHRAQRRRRPRGRGPPGPANAPSGTASVGQWTRRTSSSVSGSP